MKKQKGMIAVMPYLFLIVLFRFLSFFFRKNHWILCERGTDARDNGYFFYCFLKEKHPEIKVYYLIDKASADYSKVKDDAVQYGSVRAFWLAFTAKKIVSSHYRTVIPFELGKRCFDWSGLSKKYYFLQHGVIKNTLVSLFGKVAPMNLFICGAKPEYDFISATYGHPDGVVQYTGLARYDRLHDIKVKNQILVMPTWRMYIQSEDDFLKSDYYKKWQSFISDSRLAEKLKENGTTLIFYAHYEMQKYMHLFNSKSENVILAKFEDYDVQTLLKESAVLITDYSSVFFDFAYMKKPIVYFQFDYDGFYSKHYKKGYFDYTDDGFGAVCKETEETVDQTIKLIKNEFKMSMQYLERTEKFFPLHDKNNCNRIFDLIMEL